MSKKWVLRAVVWVTLLVILVSGSFGCSGGKVKISPTPTRGLVLATKAPVTKASPTKIVKEELAAKLYSDKNGYFTFLPPKGWSQKDFPTDPRSKVEFNGPDSVLIRIIAQTTQGVTSKNVVEETRKQSEAGAQTLKKQFPSLSQSTEEGHFAGLRAALVTQSIPGQMEQELTVFVAGNILFNIAYTAPNRAALEKYRKIAQESLAILAFSEKINLPVSDEGVRKETIARAIRLAQLLTQMGNFSGAEEQISLALKKYPDDTRLKEALGLVKAKKIIPDGF